MAGIPFAVPETRIAHHRRAFAGLAAPALPGATPVSSTKLRTPLHRGPTYTEQCMNRIILGACLLFTPLTSFAQLTNADHVTSPIIAADNAALKNTSLDAAMADAWLDAPLSANGDGCYLATHGKITPVNQRPDTLRHVKTCGSFDAPYANLQWVRKTCQRDASNFCTNRTSGSYAFTSFPPGLAGVVNLWFTSIYNPGGDERLAFIHEENADYTGFGATGQGWEGRTRIGLAYSSDNGDTWTYIGRIASPHQDPMPFNVQGTPYYIHDGDFYIWYKDKNGAGTEGFAVSKANVASVLSAARSSSLGSNLWLKKTPSGWNSNIASEPAFPAPAAEGIAHAQAARAADGNYYMLTTIMAGTSWGTTGSYVALFTVDPSTLAWTRRMDIVNEPIAAFDPDAAGNGYQYASIVDPSGTANGEVGASFYVYSAKFQDSTAPFKQALYQWQVHLTTPADFYKQSRGFTSGTQGQNHWNYAAVLSGNHMSWNTGGFWWQPSDIYNRIYNGGASTGDNDGFLMIWTAPRNGNVRVRQTVRSAQPTPSCGDGVNFAFQKNSSVQFSGHVDWDDTLGHSSTLSLPVVAGDNLYFYGIKGSNHYCDNLFWDPSIVYQ
jgi:hypothetical protein